MQVLSQRGVADHLKSHPSYTKILIALRDGLSELRRAFLELHAQRFALARDNFVDTRLKAACASLRQWNGEMPTMEHMGATLLTKGKFAHDKLGDIEAAIIANRFFVCCNRSGLA